MASWWSTTPETDGSSEEAKSSQSISRDSYTPVPLDPTSIVPPPTDSLIERARLQHRIWQNDLTKDGINPLHMVTMLANVNTLHTLLCAGIYCPKKTMEDREINPIILLSSQPDDNSANMCLKMFLNAVHACETEAIEPIGTYKYVACKQCFKKIERKPVAQKSEELVDGTAMSDKKKLVKEQKPKH